MERRGEYKVFWRPGHEWWQVHIEAAERNPRFALRAARIMGFETIFRIFSESENPRLKAAAYYLAAILAREETVGNLPYQELKELYLLAPINHKSGTWITTAMHIAKDVPPEEQAWLNSRACPCEALPHGFAYE